MTADGAVDPAYAALLWRRYDTRARGVVDTFGGSPQMIKADGGELDAPYSFEELRWVGDNELVVTSDDFLRRRSSLALTTPAPILGSAQRDIATALRAGTLRAAAQ